MPDDERLPERQVPETWIPVDSSWIDAVRYHHDTRSFDIRVKPGKVYTAGPNFRDCTPAEFLDFLASPSKGQWIWSHYPIQDLGGHRKRRGRKKRK